MPIDVRDVVIDEFKAVFSRHGYTTPQEFLRIAEVPFDLRRVQLSVNSDINRIREEYRYRTFTERARRVQDREKYHEQELRKLSRQYALKILSEIRRGYQLTESRAYSEQRSLKEEAGAGCDMYPCGQQFRAR